MRQGRSLYIYGKSRPLEIQSERANYLPYNKTGLYSVQNSVIGLYNGRSELFVFIIEMKYYESTYSMTTQNLQYIKH